ncbi:MAG: PhnA domain-containing protein [Flavobacteriales bacterium]|nr:PhnA domain-containing protein [Flavobacteriales bacterium]
MSILDTLNARSNTHCELCGTTNDLQPFEISGSPYQDADAHILACPTCREQIADPAKTDPNHWRCLNDSMWSEVNAVKVAAWRMLHRMRAEGWPQDLLDMLYLDEEILAWAKNAPEVGVDESTPQHKDSNGAILQNGDTVTLIKELNVKGATFAAKRGTAVRNISLVHDNPEQIEGRVNGQMIVILTQYVKKSN